MSNEAFEHGAYDDSPEQPEPVWVRCNYFDRCGKQCGAKKAHSPSECEPCPFSPSAKCVEVEIRQVK